jgi:L-threonylcarbamoyladenylate synthase
MTTVSGYVFSDTNRNGKRDGDEQCYEGWVQFYVNSVKQALFESHSSCNTYSFQVARRMANTIVMSPVPSGCFFLTPRRCTGIMRPMRTEILSASDPAAITRAVELLRQSSVVALPTDTVYGVGVHGFDAVAIEKLYAAKERPRDKAIPLLLARADDLRLVASDVPEIAWRLATRFWPGGLTLVLPRAPHLPDILCAEGPSIAVRVPDHQVTLALIAALGVPLAATSANRSGHPDPLTADEVARELGGRIALILDGGRAPGGIASTVIDLTTDPPTLRRVGAIPVEKLREVVPSLR